MNQKILSMQDLNEMRENIANFNSRVVEFYSKFDALLKLFEDEAVVQSFYESGFLGSSQKDRLFKLRKSIERYIDGLTDGPDSLIRVIERFIREQMDIISMETRGYSITESQRARREGNRQ